MLKNYTDDQLRDYVRDRCNNDPKGTYWLNSPGSKIGKIVKSRFDMLYPHIAGTAEKCYWFVHDLKEYPTKCKTCGKDATIFWGFRQGYLSEFCSTKCSHSHPDTQEKKRKTCIEKYGVDNVTKAPQIKKAFFEKYGVRTFASLKTTIDKRSRTVIEQTLAQKIKLQPDFEPLFTASAYNGSKETHPWRHITCGEIFDGVLRNGTKLRCPKCEPPLCGTSKAEIELADFVKSSTNKTVLRNKRSVIPPYELDIFVPELNLAFEYDGLYHHSYDAPETSAEKNYHLMKTELCEKQGIRLVHIFENEWLNNEDLVRSRILNLLGGNKTIGARQCAIAEITSADADSFLRKNHIQGSCIASTKLGLIKDDELVAVMTFGKPRFSKNADIELLRYANILGYSVVGGASRLLKYYIAKYSPARIISYSDRRWNTGNLYKKLGFVFVGCSKPSYFYTRNQFELFHRSNFMKHKLANKLGPSFDPAKTESQNMFDAGYRRIWDCGTSKWLFENELIKE